MIESKPNPNFNTQAVQPHPQLQQTPRKDKIKVAGKTSSGSAIPKQKYTPSRPDQQYAHPQSLVHSNQRSAITYDAKLSRQPRTTAEPGNCNICRNNHPLNAQCDIENRGTERCGLCGLAHFSVSETCPHLASEVQIRLMLDALQKSKETPDKVEIAKNHLRGLLADRQRRKSRPVVEIPVRRARPL